MTLSGHGRARHPADGKVCGMARWRFWMLRIGFWVFISGMLMGIAGIALGVTSILITRVPATGLPFERYFLVVAPLGLLLLVIPYCPYGRGPLPKPFDSATLGRFCKPAWFFMLGICLLAVAKGLIRAEFMDSFWVLLVALALVAGAAFCGVKGLAPHEEPRHGGAR